MASGNLKLTESFKYPYLFHDEVFSLLAGVPEGIRSEA